MQPVPKAGKRAAGVERGKTCNGCQARESMVLVSSAVKRATSAKLIGSKQQHVSSDWLEHFIRNFVL